MGNRIEINSQRMIEKIPHVLMVFLDGVGVGRKNSHTNPFFMASLPALEDLLDGEMFHLRNCHRSNSIMSLKSINATLGIPGLPQSGTGQASLLTGINAPRYIDKHFGPHLYSILKPLVAEKSLFKRLQSKGKKCYYANAFPKQYFEYLNSSKHRVTAITHSWISAGNRLNDHSSLVSTNALSADITNERWHKLGYPEMPIISTQEAGKRLVDIARRNNFVLYEYFFTDHAGHSQSRSEAVEVLEKLDGFLDGILNSLKYDSMLFIIVSDHGNLEDLSTKSHTRNPIPLFAIGKGHCELTARIKNLSQIAPAILDLLL